MSARSGFPAAMLIVAVAVAVAEADTPPADHLQCYGVRRDPLQLRALVDLFSSQYGLAPGCRIRKSAVEFCVPASKTVREAQDGGTRPPTPITPLPGVGAPAAGDYVCYKVSCPDEQLPKEQPVTDQFGGRTLGRLRTTKLCTPAVKGTTTSSTTTTTTRCTQPTTTTNPPCGEVGCFGWCANAQFCVSTGPTASDCACTGGPRPCAFTGPGPDGGLTCGGTCPEGQTCQPIDTDPSPDCVFLFCGCQ